MSLLSRDKIREYNLLRKELQQDQERLARMEAHEGDDGTPEDVAGQCRLVDEIAEKTRRVRVLRRELYG